MDIFKRLKQEHQQFREILGRLLKTTSRTADRREEMISQLYSEMGPHLLAEEEVLYPVFLDKKSEHENGVTYEEEHRLAKQLLQELSDMPKDDDNWKPRLRVLNTLFEYHAGMEEKQIFKRAKEIAGPDKVKQLSQRYEEAYEEAKQSQMAPMSM
ncbi:MAG: hemerythrin domain-containing protein [Candidatus Zixiibacteriota bacterium]|nr:MAG: hemerythrin domain-containing protein [candidate division Zixibacteria bacterium]